MLWWSSKTDRRTEAGGPSFAAFGKGWGIAERPSSYPLAIRLVEENGPSTTLRTCYRKRYPTLHPSEQKNARRGPRPFAKCRERVGHPDS